MSTHGFVGRAMRALASLAAFLAVASCGGGGGSSEKVSAVFNPPRLDSQAVEGNAQSLSFDAQISFTGQSALYLLVEDPGNMVGSANPTVSGNTLYVSFTTRQELPAGTYDQPLILHVCKDQECKSEVSGSPMSLPFHLVVAPNIHLTEPLPFVRQGQTPGAPQTLTLTIPPEAGDVSITTGGMGHAFGVSRQGNQLTVTPQLVRAGTYNATLTVQGQTDWRYSASVPLQYTVLAPDTGEAPMSAEPQYFQVAMQQGDVASYRFKLQRATWDASLSAPELSGSPLTPTLRDLGNDEYELSFDTRTVDPLQWQGSLSGSASVTFRGGPLVSPVSVSFYYSIGSSYSLTNPSLDVSVNAKSTAADLKRSTGIVMTDGSAVIWRASSNQPWLKLSRTTGTTGLDELGLEVDASAIANGQFQQTTDLTLSVDKPGVLPMVRTFQFTNLIPRLEMAAPGALQGSSARVFVMGSLPELQAALAPGVFEVQGARLKALSAPYDTRYIGFVGALQVDLEGITPGQAVTLKLNSVLSPSSITLPYVAPARQATGYASLPLAAYRPPSVDTATGAVYFSGNETLLRWAPGASAWAAPQLVRVPGLADAALAPDGGRVYGLRNRQVVSFNPSTLEELGATELYKPSASYFAFETSGPSNGKLLNFAVDGRALASFTMVENPPYGGGHGMGWLCAVGGVPNLLLTPNFCEPGSGEYYFGDGTPGSAVSVRSPLGQSVAISYPSGKVAIYRRLDEARINPGNIPKGATITAVSDSGNWAVQDNGELRARHFSWTIATNLAARVPSGYVAGGYGLSGNDMFALVYGYKIMQEGNGPRARDPKLWVLDLYQAPVNTNSFAVLAEISLPEAVGCNTAMPAGETCQHSANITMTPGDHNAIILGPRGVLAVPMPASLDVALSVSRAKSLKAAASTRNPGNLSPIIHMRPNANRR